MCLKHVCACICKSSITENVSSKRSGIAPSDGSDSVGVDLISLEISLLFKNFPEFTFFFEFFIIPWRVSESVISVNVCPCFLSVCLSVCQRTATVFIGHLAVELLEIFCTRLSEYSCNSGLRVLSCLVMVQTYTATFSGN